MIAGAAMAKYFLTPTEKVCVEKQIVYIGPVIRDSNGYIEFECFLKIFEISSQIAKS